MPTNSKDYMSRYRKARFELLRLELGNECYICKGSKCYNLDLQFAHIKPTKLNGLGRGKHNRMNDIIKNRDCYRLIGKTCHKEFDKNG